MKTLASLVYSAIGCSYSSKESVRIRRESDGVDLYISTSQEDDDQVVLIVYSEMIYNLLEVKAYIQPEDVAIQLTKFGLNPLEYGWTYDIDKLKERYRGIKKKALDLRDAIRKLENEGQCEADLLPELIGQGAPVNVYEFANEHKWDVLEVVQDLLHIGVFEEAINKDLMIPPILADRLERERSSRE